MSNKVKKYKAIYKTMDKIYNKLISLYNTYDVGGDEAKYLFQAISCFKECHEYINKAELASYHVCSR